MTMGAFEIHLETWLQQAVMEDVLTLSEAWKVQDHYMATLPDEDGFVTMPEDHWQIAQRLHLWEVELEGAMVH